MLVFQEDKRFYRDFNDFIQNFPRLIKKNTVLIKARPNQPLMEHLTNILKRNLAYFAQKTRHREKYIPYFALSSIINSIAHDLGKLIPIFQYKIYRIVNPGKYIAIPNRFIHFSYHTLFGAMCSWIIYDRLADECSDSVKNLALDLKLLKYLSSEAILSHHSYFLLSEIDEQTSILYDEYIEEYFQQINVFINELDHFFILLARTVQNILKNSEFLRDQVGDDENLLQLINHIPAAIKTLGVSFKNGFFDCDELIDLYDEISPGKFGSLEFKFPKSTVFCLTSYVSSLLFDLDVWDARYHNNPDKTDIFEFCRQNEKPNTSLVENYVSNPFGKIIDNFSAFNPIKVDGIIQFLRNSLFMESNQNDQLNNKIFILNSPTGAGKTLSLLNISLKASKHMKNPQVIYALPFVSIGIQVAETIAILYDSDPNNLYSSEILTIDNYAMDSIWQSGQQEKDEIEDFLYGEDAKWLINSWQSRFVVTTFVKLFHRLLKPYKNNIIGFHRLHDTIIILDEIQCIPVEYWELTKEIIINLTDTLNCKVILSTATQPAIFDINTSTSEIIDIAPCHLNKVLPHQISTSTSNGKSLSDALNRYTILFLDKKLGIVDFADMLNHILAIQPFLNDDILITVNTKSAAVYLFNELTNNVQLSKKNSEIVMLSTLVLPKHRQELIHEIKHEKESEKRYIIIATQVIEAGVDLSFKYVFRDLAPLDSVIQVAGRCNRSFESEMGFLFLFQLIDNTKSGNNQSYFHQVYHTTEAEENTINLIKESVNTVPKIPIAIKAALKYKMIDREFLVTDEKSLRRNFSSYFEKIKPHNYHRTLEKEFKELDFRKLAKEYRLIDDDYQNQVLLLIDDEICNEHQGWKNGHRLNNLFYKYLVSLPNRWFHKLKQNNEIEAVYDKDGNVLYYYIPRKTCNEYYNNRSGFIL